MLAERLLAPVRDAEVDTLLLGCTHYPFLARTISDVMGRDVVLVSSADETAFEVRASARRDRSRARHRMRRPGTHRFLSSGDVEWFRELGGGCSVPSSCTSRRCHGTDGMALSVTVLGCSGTLRRPGRRVQRLPRARRRHERLARLRPGHARQPAAAHRPRPTLDAVVVSHSHPDHWVELPVFRNALKYGFEVEGMPVYSTSAVRELVDIVCGDSSEPTFDWGIVADGDRVDDRRPRVHVRPHRPPGRDAGDAHRGRAGSRSLYSADTGPELVARAARPRRRPRALRGHAARRDRGRACRTCSARQAGPVGQRRPASADLVAHPPLADGSDPRRHEAEAAEAFGRSGRASPCPARRSPYEDAEELMPRPDGRAADELRPITFERDYTEIAAGSVLVSFGRTRVLCTASVDEDVPRWMRGSGKGWVTAEYSMLPGSSPERIDREAASGKQSGRTQEIQRLIGRSLRAVTDMAAARRAADHRRLRRAPGRRRHAHRVDLRRLPRAARRAQPARAAGTIKTHPLIRALRRDLGRHRRRRCPCSTSPTSRTPRPRST